MNHKLLFILLSVLTFIIPAWSQIALEWELLSRADGDNLNSPFNQTNIMAHDFKLNIGIPVVLSSTETEGEQEPTFVISNNVFFGNKHLIVKKWPDYSLDEDQNYILNLKDTYDHLVSFGYSAMLIKTISNKWSLLGIGGFTYAGINPKNYLFEDIGFNGGFGGIYSWTDKWSAGIGLYYSRLTGSGQILPLLIFKRETENSILNITLPSDIAYWYHFSKSASVGFLGQLQGDMYSFVGIKVNQYDANGKYVSSDNKVGLAYSALTIGPAIRLSVFKGIAVIARAGFALYRRYEYFVPGENEVLRYETNPDYISIAGHDYSGEKVEFPAQSTGFVKITLGFGI